MTSRAGQSDRELVEGPEVGVLLLAWLTGRALAQDGTTIDIAPNVDAQIFHPSADAIGTLWTDDNATGVDGFVGRAAASWAHNPLVVVRGDTGESEALVSNIFELDAIIGYRQGRWRAALELPIIAANSEAFEGGAGLGDLGLDLRASLLDPAESPVGLGVAGRLQAPTATVDLPVGASGFAWELRGIVDTQFGSTGRARWAFNGGYRGQPEVELGQLVDGDRLLLRTGFSFAIDPDQGYGVSAEVGGEALVTSDLGETGNLPLEGLLGGWYRVTDHIVLRGGGGAGLTPGIGAAQARAVVLISREPLPDQDRDRDQIENKRDRCPDQAEDLDGLQDDDGCPEAPSPVALRVRDPYGAVVNDAVVVVTGRNFNKEFGSTAQIELPPGNYTVMVRAEGYEPGDDIFTVTMGQPAQVVMAISPIIQVTERVKVEKDRISISEKIYFETGSAEIKPESFSLLNEIALTLQDHPEILRISIEGHTDSRGSDQRNMTLSANRAASVRDYLIARGIKGDRLASVGYGESRPVDSRETEAGWEMNRRVEFLIVERRD